MNSDKQSWFQRVLWRLRYKRCLKLVESVRSLESPDFTAQCRLDDAGNALIAAAHIFLARSEK